MKVLIIDEAGRTVRRLRPALEEEGHRVETASSPGEARWVAAETETDVVIACSARAGAHELPVVSGLRQDGDSSPILVIARHADSDGLVGALDAGADDVVVSPVSFAEIAARLRALARRRGELVVDDLRVGTLRLDRGARSAVRETPAGEVHLELTCREFALLEMLMEHPGQVFSRTRLLERVWGVEPDLSSNIVDQVVSRLRAKLDRPFGCTDVTTVRGVGYSVGGVRSVQREHEARSA